MPRPPVDRDLLAAVGRRLAEARRARGWTQADLSDRCGIEAATLSRWETGAASPTLTALVRVAGALGVGAGALLDPDVGQVPVRLAALLDDLDKLTDEQLDLVARVARGLAR